MDELVNSGQTGKFGQTTPPHGLGITSVSKNTHIVSRKKIQDESMWKMMAIVKLRIACRIKTKQKQLNLWEKKMKE